MIEDRRGRESNTAATARTPTAVKMLGYGAILLLLLAIILLTTGVVKFGPF